MAYRWKCLVCSVPFGTVAAPAALPSGAPRLPGAEPTASVVPTFLRPAGCKWTQSWFQASEAFLGWKQAYSSISAVRVYKAFSQVFCCWVLHQAGPLRIVVLLMKKDKLVRPNLPRDLSD